MRDFVEWWFYKSVSDNREFPNDVRDLLDHIFSRLGTAAASVDWTAFVTKRVNHHIFIILETCMFV
jgi:hypothetical protein